MIQESLPADDNSECGSIRYTNIIVLNERYFLLCQDTLTKCIKFLQICSLLPTRKRIFFLVDNIVISLCKINLRILRSISRIYLHGKFSYHTNVSISSSYTQFKGPHIYFFNLNQINGAPITYHCEVREQIAEYL